MIAAAQFAGNGTARDGFWFCVGVMALLLFTIWRDERNSRPGHPQKRRRRPRI